LVLSTDERETLERWARRPKSAQALAVRCRVVLSCAEGLDNKVVAGKLGLNEATVSKWRRRFVEKRLEGLSDDPRPGPARTITDDVVEAVIVKTLEELPRDATHWSTRSLAAQMGMSQSAVSRIWRAFGLKPHLVDSFKLSNDPQFIEKVRDVVGLYLNPQRRPWSLVWTRKRRCRRSTGPRRPSPCARACPPARPMTMCATARRTSTPPSTWPRGR
jgi:transposase